MITMDICAAKRALGSVNIPEMKLVDVEYLEDTEITCGVKTVKVSAGVLRIRAVSEHPGGTFTRVEVWLPAECNGIIVSLGNGGLGGGIDVAGLAYRSAQGYATAHTDLGTSAGRVSGIGNAEVWADFGYRANKYMTDTVKTCFSAVYGRTPERSYFIGCSTGGQQALSVAQRYPREYDGIAAIKPANNRVNLHTYFLWNYVHLRKKDGTAAFTREEAETITSLAAHFFKDRVEGGNEYYYFPYKDESTVGDFIKYLAENTDFGKEQLSALRAVYEGPVDTLTGERIYNGMPIGSERYGCGIADCEGSEPPHFYPFLWALGDGYDPYSFDFGSDLKTVRDTLSPYLDSTDTDLTAFRDAGGKLLVYSGTADPCVPFPDAVSYYEAVCRRMGGYSEVGRFFRTFIADGMDHGVSGLGAAALVPEYGKNELDVLRAWVEKGTPPDVLYAVNYVKSSGTSGCAGTTEAEMVARVYPYLSEGAPARAYQPAYGYDKV